MTDQELVLRCYPSAICQIHADSIRIFGRIMYQVLVEYRYGSGIPFMKEIALSTKETGAWNTAWREVQRLMLKKLES